MDAELPVFVAEGKYQKGNSFGKRLANEVEKIFNSGFEKIIVIGNDCPELTTDHLLQANQACHSNKVVVGPTSDGGAYLLAFHKNQFDKKAFIALDWETSDFHSSFIAYVKEQQVQLELLVELQDVDNQQQLVAVLKKLSRFHQLKKFFKQLTQQLHFNGFHYHKLTPQLSQLYFIPSRAP